MCVEYCCVCVGVIIVVATVVVAVVVVAVVSHCCGDEVVISVVSLLLVLLPPFLWSLLCSCSLSMLLSVFCFFANPVFFSSSA